MNTKSIRMLSEEQRSSLIEQLSTIFEGYKYTFGDGCKYLVLSKGYIEIAISILSPDDFDHYFKVRSFLNDNFNQNEEKTELVRSSIENHSDIEDLCKSERWKLVDCGIKLNDESDNSLYNIQSLGENYIISEGFCEDEDSSRYSYTVYNGRIDPEELRKALNYSIEFVAENKESIIRIIDNL